MFLLELGQDNIVRVDKVQITNPELISKAFLADNKQNEDELGFLLKELEPNRYLMGVAHQSGQFYILNTAPGHQHATISKVIIGDSIMPSPKEKVQFIAFQEDSLVRVEVSDPIKKQQFIKLIDWRSKEMICYVQYHNSKERFSTRLAKGRYLLQYSDGDETNVEIKMIDYQLTMDDGYLHLLEHLNDGFDDDLLQDCIALLQ
jgi:hypothetical protein